MINLARESSEPAVYSGGGDNKPLFGWRGHAPVETILEKRCRRGDRARPDPGTQDRLSHAKELPIFS